MTINISPQATAQEQYAAKELQHYLSFITTTRINISDEAIGEVIAIGSASESLGIKSDAKLGEDGFTIRRVGNSLGIVGGKRGIIYGVYEFLERLGCRFFSSKCEIIPSIMDLELPEIDDTQVPILEYRLHNYIDLATHPRFAVKSRLNGNNIKEKFGGNMAYVWFVHSFKPSILNPEEWFDTHPEYFSMVDNVRIKEQSQLCLTNPDVLKIAIEKVKIAIRENPEKRIISISQNDCYNYCTCPECKKIDEYEQSNAGSLIWFVNQIAQAIEPEFPDVIIDTLAYQYSRPAPKYIRPRHNVCVRLCSIEACFAHPFEKCDDKTRCIILPNGTVSSFIEDLQNWSKVCDRLYIWDYTTSFSNYPAPHPNWNTLQPNMKTFIKNNVKGVFEQGCAAIGGGVDLNELRAYLISKLLWDANCDYEKHMMEFLEYYYGEAAPYLRKYIKELSDCVEKNNVHVGFHDTCEGGHLTFEMLDIYDALFEEAQKAVIGNSIHTIRVHKARLGIRWVRIKNNAMLKNIKNEEEINQFFTDWKAHGMTRLEEWVSAETSFRALIDNQWRGEDYYKHWADEGGEEL